MSRTQRGKRIRFWACELAEVNVPRPCWSFFLVTSIFVGAMGLSQAEDIDADTAFEADESYLREHYTKHEFEIPMRDGVKLFTAVYAPKDQSEKYPILLKRTPYGLKPYGVDNYPAEPGGPLKFYADEPFIFVFQDVRGRNGSGGRFEHVRPHVPRKKSVRDIDESTDTYDTIDWLVKNVDNHNGRVGMSGISYPGFYTVTGMIDAHPALKCCSPQAPIADWFIGDDFRHNGAFYLAHAFRFISYFGQPLENPTRQRAMPFDFETPDGYEFYLDFGRLADAESQHLKPNTQFWRELIEHDTYDAFWQARAILPHVKKIKPAVMTVGGWFDAEDLYGPLNVYQTNEKNSPGSFNMLVMGPWAHGGWHRAAGDHLGHVAFHQQTSRFFREHIELPFLRHFLKGAEDPSLPEAFVFETGTNQWRKYGAWPPKQSNRRSLYFHPAGVLSFEAPAADDDGGYDEYVSDPAKPVPFIPNIAIGMTREHMVDDQRFSSTRTDVLVYATEPLEEDITIAGSIEPELYVSTTGTDSDWVVKLIDVYPGDFPNPDPNPAGVEMGNYQQLVRGEAMRGRFRNSRHSPEPFEPGAVTKVGYTMPDAFHTFRRGHRIMVHVQSSWFPLIDRNPQKFVRIHEAQPDDYQRATQRVYRKPQSASQIRLRILEN